MNKIATTDFKRLIGVWKTSGHITTKSGTTKLSGMDTYELILDGNYILHKANVMMGDERSQTFEIISLHHLTGKAKMHFFNSKNESGLMTGEFNNENFKINGEGIKFNGTINAKSTVILGNWYLQSKNNDWEQFIELKLEKQN
jgi:hypothetical protein